MFHRSSGSDRSHFVSSTTTIPADIEDLELLQRTPKSQKQQHQQQQHQQQQQQPPHQEFGSPHSSLLGSPHRNRRPIAHSQLEDSLLLPSFLQPSQVEDPSTRNNQLNNGGATTIINYPNDNDNKKIRNSTMLKAICQYMSTTRLLVLVILCLQNSLFTVLRRYSQGVLQEVYSKVRQ